MSQAPLLISLRSDHVLQKEVGNSNAKWFGLGAYFELTWEVWHGAYHMLKLGLKDRPRFKLGVLETLI